MNDMKSIKPAKSKAPKPAIVKPDVTPVAAVETSSLAIAAELAAESVALAPGATAPATLKSAPAAPVPQKGNDTHMTDMNRTADQAADTAKFAADRGAETVHNVADKAQAAFADMNGRAKDVVAKGQKMVEDMNDFHKGNLEAVVESAKVAAKGTEEIVRYTVDYAKKTVERANADAKTIASIKSPTEFVQFQSDRARASFDEIVAETSKFTENYIKLLGNIAQPLSNRFAVAAEKVKLAA